MSCDRNISWLEERAYRLSSVQQEAKSVEQQIGSAGSATREPKNQNIPKTEEDKVQQQVESTTSVAVHENKLPKSRLIRINPIPVLRVKLVKEDGLIVVWYIWKMAGSELKLSLRLLLASRQISCLHKSAASSAFQNTCFQSAPRINRLQSYHFRNHSTNSPQYPLIYNHGLISSWHTRFPKSCISVLHLFTVFAFAGLTRRLVSSCVCGLEISWSLTERFSIEISLWWEIDISEHRSFFGSGLFFCWLNSTFFWLRSTATGLSMWEGEERRNTVWCIGLFLTVIGHLYF